MTLQRRPVVLGILGALASPSHTFASFCMEPIQVLVVPVMHKLHQGNALYSYSDIYRIVAEFRPDQVGVEIRQEDLGRDDDYLAQNYPVEMVHLAKIYGVRAFGFDWLGDDLAGRAVPAGWWKNDSLIKKLERLMNAEPPSRSLRDKRLEAELSMLEKQQEDIAKSATAKTLANGRYDVVAAKYYSTLRQITNGTRFSALSWFYASRDAHLSDDVVRRLSDMKGGRVAIVTGMDHHGPMIEAIKRRIHCVTIMPVH